ncbi:hypothetical protein I552_7817 [Mycobacterium xenopi 3993]|nr:hypothetical protein I552_7817 [Mycobacterium xenopi 3993]
MVITNTCSCMSVTPRSAVLIGPRAVFSCGTTLMLERRAPEFVQIEGKTDGCRHSCHNGLRMLRLIWRSGFAGELAPRLLRSELHHSRMTSGHRGEEA